MGYQQTVQNLIRCRIMWHLIRFCTIYLHNVYPTKKKRTTTIFPLRSPFNTKMLIVMKYSFFILLKRECDVDEYLYFPCVGTKQIKANGKRVFESVYSTLRPAWNSKYVLHLQSMKMICCCYVRQPMCLLTLFRNFKIHYHQLGPFKLIKTILKSLNVS